MPSYSLMFMILVTVIVGVLGFGKFKWYPEHQKARVVFAVCLGYLVIRFLLFS